MTYTVLDSSEIKEKEGELYIGAIVHADGHGHHIILLDGDNEREEHQTQMDWAKEKGGDLPNRVEQALLYDRFKDQFKHDWYWSNTTHTNNTGWAWSQDFGSGLQDSDRKLSKLRTRAVRRVHF